MLPDYQWPDPEDRADQLVPVVLEIAERIRAEPVLPLLSELLGPLDGYETWAVVALLAAAVDPTQHPDVLFGWARHRAALDAAAPIVWDEGEQPIEELDSEQINGLIERMSREGRRDWEIGDRVGLRPEAVQQRRLRLRRTDKAGAAVA